MLTRREGNTRCTEAWRRLHQEYGLGCLIDNKMLHWSRDDLKRWRNLIDTDRPAHEAAQAGVDRTAISEYTANEKLTKASVQDQRLFCHAINAPLYLSSGEQPVHPDIEYRVHHQTIDINRYAACLVIENLESYVYCQRFNWPSLPPTLVLYRGHDKSVQALRALLNSRKEAVNVYIFPDTDPAGMGIAMSMPEATHIIAPDVLSLPAKGLLRDRFAAQLQRLPNLRSQVRGFSESFQLLVSDILQTGTAVSQEWLCAHQVPLKLIALRE
jgi:hypothetical protein